MKTLIQFVLNRPLLVSEYPELIDPSLVGSLAFEQTVVESLFRLVLHPPEKI